MNYIVEVRPKNKTRALAINDQQVLRVILKASNRAEAAGKAGGAWHMTCPQWRCTGRRTLKLTAVIISEGTAGDYIDTAIRIDLEDAMLPHVVMDCLVVHP